MIWAEFVVTASRHQTISAGLENCPTCSPMDATSGLLQKKLPTKMRMTPAGSGSMRGKSVEVVLKAQSAEVAVRPLQDHPPLRRGAPKQGHRRAGRRTRAHGRQVAQAVRREAHRGPLGRIPVRTAPHRDRRQGRGGDRANAEHDAAGRDALVGPEHGREHGRVAHDGAPDLVGVRPEAAPERIARRSSFRRTCCKSFDRSGPETRQRRGEQLLADRHELIVVIEDNALHEVVTAGCGKLSQT